jgi:hypothetical protein
MIIAIENFSLRLISIAGFCFANRILEFFHIPLSPHQQKTLLNVISSLDIIRVYRKHFLPFGDGEIKFVGRIITDAAKIILSDQLLLLRSQPGTGLFHDALPDTELAPILFTATATLRFPGSTARIC